MPLIGSLLRHIVAANSPHIVFERVLAAVGECLDRQSAEALIQARADEPMQERIASVSRVTACAVIRTDMRT